MKYLLNECSLAESTAVTTWLQADAGNEKYFNELLQVWQQGAVLGKESDINTDAAWQRFQHKINPTVAASKTRTIITWQRVAAIFILVAGLAFIAYWRMTDTIKPVVAMATDAVLTDTLPDGSVVTLNKGASLQYPAAFTKDKRPVQLKGEAFFAITPNKNKPFEITVNDVLVRVVGTSFNIKTVGNRTEVIVETGRVEVIRNKQRVLLNPGEQIITGAENEPLKKDTVSDGMYNYYRTKEFVCNNTPLWKLVEKLNEAYKTTIIIDNPELKQLLLTATFSNESLDKVLEVVALTFSIKVVKEGDRILLR